MTLRSQGRGMAVGSDGSRSGLGVRWGGRGEGAYYLLTVLE
jgi:hypothetical protein